MPVVVVTGVDGVLGAGLASGLDAAGADVVRVAGTFQSVEAARAAIPPSTEAVVHAAVEPVALEVRDLADVDDARWEAVWERTTRGTLYCLQAAHGVLRGRSGRILVVVPTLGMSGAAGLAPLSTAVEGQRLLVKSAARQWGDDGITVNCLAVAPELLLGDQLHGDDVSLFPPALGRAGDVAGDLAPVVAWLAGSASGFVTGLTLSIDGGVWMAP